MSERALAVQLEDESGHLAFADVKGSSRSHRLELQRTITQSARSACLLVWPFVSTLPTVAVSALGFGLIALAGRDVFDALFHPEGKGTLGHLIMRGVWAAFRQLARARPGAFALAGPTALLLVIGSWAALLILGWALIFWPHIYGGFYSAVAVHPGTFVEALHISLVTITTVGFSDVIPHAGWLRVVAPLEALLGFGLLSASISWLLLIYPALSRRRSLAYEISLLIEAERQTGVVLERLESASAERIYAELTSRLVAVERDLVSFPISYYFAELDERFALAAQAPRLYQLAERGASTDMPESARLRAWMLLEALRDFSATTAERFHRRPGRSTTEALAAYAHDHMRSV